MTSTHNEVPDSAGVTAETADSEVDLAALRAYRLERVRHELVRRDYAAIVLYDPINIRYATDTSNMQVFTLHNPLRYAFVPAHGPVTMFEPSECLHLARGIETVDEVRPATTWHYLGAGSRRREKAGRWAAELADLIRDCGGENRRLAIDLCEPIGAGELEALGLSLHDGQEVMEEARLIKSDEEITAISEALAACEAGMHAMREALEPGITENQLWAILHYENIARGGEWIETRLLASGPRTNPWFQECSDRPVEAGDLVCFDTDLIGRHGYFADISRCWLVGDGRPSDEQRRLYAAAFEQLQHNQALLKPGVEVRDYVERAWQLPEVYVPNRYADTAHGAGMSVEFPVIPYSQDFEAAGYDAVIAENMVMCVESYIGATGGREGVKLEQQVLITSSGAVPLASYPFEEALL